MSVRSKISRLFKLFARFLYLTVRMVKFDFQIEAAKLGQLFVASGGFPSQTIWLLPFFEKLCLVALSKMKKPNVRTGY